MIIHKFNFPFYGIFIVAAIIVGMLYVYFTLKKAGYIFKEVLLYFVMYISFAFIFGKIYTVLIFGGNFLTAGLSSYGGLIGVVLCSIIFEKLFPSGGKIVKYSILSLPLVYGLSKISCAIVGCCGGIPYDGIFKVKYVDVLNIWQFPVQICEVIVSLLIFFICRLLHKNKNINYIVLVFVSVFKFLLDFLRYDHVNVLITKNQIFSIILLIVTIIVWLFNCNKVRLNVKGFDVN